MGMPSNYLPRAERFAIPIAILYRSAGETDWRSGLTENISRSGVLFRADRRLEPNTALEMLLDIPTVVATTASGNALRRGRVVRASAPSPLEERPAVAAAFVDFQHTPPLDPRRI
jgi:PilZ domain-containing protein